MGLPRPREIKAENIIEHETIMEVYQSLYECGILEKVNRLANLVAHETFNPLSSWRLNIVERLITIPSSRLENSFTDYKFEP